MEKRGQFFLFMAFIVVIAFVGLGTIYTSVKAPAEDYYFIDLSEQMQLEGYNVIDNGVFNALTQAQINENVELILEVYAKANLDSDIIAVYGDENDMSVANYEEEITGSVGISTGAASAVSQQIKKKVINRPSFTLSGSGEKKIKVTLSNNVQEKENLTYEFKLKKGQNFFLALKKQRGDEIVVLQK
jgi:hypothetical protein